MPARASRRKVLPLRHWDGIEASGADHFSSSPQLSTDSNHNSSSAPQGTESLPFYSILFDRPERSIEVDGQGCPPIFADLNLDQIVDAITADRDEYNLKPYFYMPLRDVETVTYRHDVLRDLEDPSVPGYVRSFAEKMLDMRHHLSQSEKLYYKYQKHSSFLDAVETYCNAVTQLTHDLLRANIASRGFIGLRGYLAGYVESDEFRTLVVETRKLRADLAGIRYSLHIAGKRVTVRKYDDELDYGADVLQTFEKFSQEAAKEYLFRYNARLEMNHVEAAVLDLVARLFPEIFSYMQGYFERHSGYLNKTIAKFDREVQFYIACHEYVKRLKLTGLPFCYPEVTGLSKEVYGNGVFDLALADKLCRGRSSVVPNDFYLRNPERILVVSGPNQGGKTTFARTFGQLHYLASIGCPVPGTDARLFLFDQLFTHFEKEEDIHDLSSKLEDELRRIRQILENATPDSILIMNESFLSTTVDDALLLSKEIMRRIVQLDMLCVSVTFLDELASFCETTVSMVSTVDANDPTLRTFKIIRMPANGLAYAFAIAQKYKLTHDAVKARIARRKRGT
jgi:DNA mismatch repair ATPase MutS